MGNLQNKLISQTYDALIQTGTDEPVDGTLRPLQDGSGQTLPVEISTTAVNFTGTVTGIDTGVQSVVAGTNVTVDNTDPANPIVSATGGGGGGLTGLSTTILQVYGGPSTGDTAYYELTIPANTFTSGDIVQFSAIARQNFDGGGWIYDACWISDSPQTGIGQYPIGGHANSGAPGAPFCVTWNKTIYIHTANGEGPTGGTTFYGDGSPIEQQTNGQIQYMDQYRIPINWTIPQYITFTAFVDNAGSQIELAGVNLVKINA
jgi:hypothetical protein